MQSGRKHIVLRKPAVEVSRQPIPPESYHALYRELAAIGNNVNQMAKLSHARGSAEYIHFAKDLETIYSIQKQLTVLAGPEELTE